MWNRRCFTRYGISVAAVGMLCPCGALSQQAAPPSGRPNAVVTGILVTGSDRPIAHDSVFCTLLRKGVAANPRAVSDGSGRFTIVIDSALFRAGSTIPGGTCVLGVYRGGELPFRALEMKGRHSGIIVVTESSLRAAAASGGAVD